MGWEPLSREQALARLQKAAKTAQQQGENGDCLVYVHGFNTNLQFTARSAALYAHAMNRPVVCAFSWPSNPPLPRNWAISAVLSVAERNYTAAEQMMQRSVPALEKVALLFREALPATCGLQWKGHSMGCYLLLSTLERLARQRKLADLFQRVILDAPDTPTWFFVEAIKNASALNVRFLHMFHPRDEAVEISRQRRGLDFPAPGNGPVLIGQPGVEVVDCSTAKASLGNHDYGRVEPRCHSDQAAFLDGRAPDDRPGLVASTEKAGLYHLKPGLT